jgi:general nucleoside transport system ATP-binding protein
VPVLEGAGLQLPGTDAEGVAREVLADIGFTIHRGEVLGIAGVEGNGQAELVEAIMGIRDPDGGTITLDGVDISHRPTRGRREAGVGYIPEDRHRHGLLLNAPLWENRLLGHQTTHHFNRRGLLRRRAAKADTDRIVAAFDVRTPSIHTHARALSGGNQQKLIIGREMSGDPMLLIAAHPTRGVDVGAQAAIWEHIKRARRDGLAVLLVSADLDELIGLSDRIEVILRGALVAEFDPDEVTPTQLGEAMTGGADEEPT